MIPDFAGRYLALLGLERRPPGLDALCEIVAAHLARVPFENISKVHYFKRRGLRDIPDPELFLEGIERFHLGGTCYALNSYLNRLLGELGYDAKLCGADMSNPDVHVVNIVTVGGREYLVDAGYAAPFTRPLPLDLPEAQVIAFGRDSYMLEPRQPDGTWRLAFSRGGVVEHGYRLKPEPRRIEEFAPVILDSYRPQATFMNHLLATKSGPENSVVIRNLKKTVIAGRTSTVETLEDRGALVRAVVETFEMPQDMVRDALGSLRKVEREWEP